ncbi:FAD-binding oxidoreductase [Campylobacter sp. faydin G-24]|uniref:FAD-binding oxidoreductase n=1 Tax=Campylobacter anatolicus TaxID=2829105 RepID=A0ABS5HIW8_9BACT|nr:FAD-binding oxidoreductase [Campylobacter anatolicus]MBR8464216.1 FAD-binding oxidoreductase [Campylobacter anatolicus]MBR8466121.1 FAD-binding oxidoreductase [Campylobacter anatolicus]
MILPKNVSEADFKAAVAEFKVAVGAENVYDKDDDIALYRDAYSPYWGEELENVPSLAVAPKSTEEVQAVVKVANKFKIPIFPISTGKNLGYGASAPNNRGDVVIDLKRMNKILEVDDKRNFCILEPGVSYFDLYEYIEKNNLNVMMDIPDPGWGSPVGNALDHGWGYTYGAYRDHFGAHCGMEVVLANGEILRTGMGALPSAKTFAENKYGYGPYLDGLFAQSNFGIVTKMGFWMQPKPEHYALINVTTPLREDIIPMVEILNYLEDSFIIGWPLYRSPLNPPHGKAMNPELKGYLTSKGGKPDYEKIQNYALKNKIPYWSVDITLYGNKEAVAANIEDVKRRFNAAIKGCEFKTLENHSLPLTAEQKKNMKHKVTLGIPNMEIFWLSTRGETIDPKDGHVWFSPIIPRDGRELLKCQEVYIDVFYEMGMPSPITPFAHPRSWMYRAFCFMLGFSNSREDSEKNKKMREVYRKMVKVAAENGWGDYRAAPDFQDDVMDAYSHNDHILRKFSEQLKDSIDPNGILAPGRGGIWPAKLRAKRGYRARGEKK